VSKMDFSPLLGKLGPEETVDLAGKVLDLLTDQDGIDAVVEWAVRKELLQELKDEVEANLGGEDQP